MLGVASCVENGNRRRLCGRGDWRRIPIASELYDQMLVNRLLKRCGVGKGVGELEKWRGDPGRSQCDSVGFWGGRLE